MFRGWTVHNQGRSLKRGTKFAANLNRFPMHASDRRGTWLAESDGPPTDTQKRVRFAPGGRKCDAVEGAPGAAKSSFIAGPKVPRHGLVRPRRSTQKRVRFYRAGRLAPCRRAAIAYHACSSPHW
ncbi:hypothetical protein CT19431_MP70081 [Cupriavidus taiwanensis]|nr:hypothetical protein CT19431_MP70081 [Cupriavidus taiwanensis]